MLFCVNCGVCCVSFCVFFYWLEVDFFIGGIVLIELIEKILFIWVVMKGIN